MQGKIEVEEHFAIAATAAKSVRPPRTRIGRQFKESSSTDSTGGSPRWMPAASNARYCRSTPTASKKFPRPQKPSNWRGTANACSAARGRQTSRPLCRARRVADAGSASRRRRTAARRARSKIQRRIGQRLFPVGTAHSTVYYDLPQYRPFWAEVERLGVPFYLHPRYSLPSRRQRDQGHPWARRIAMGFCRRDRNPRAAPMGCGLFDEMPKLQIVLGHLGERIPFDLWRLDHRMKMLPYRPAKRPMAEHSATTSTSRPVAISARNR